MSPLAFLIPNMAGGGAEKVTMSLVNGAVRRGHTVDLILMQKEGPNLQFVDSAVRVIDLKAARIRNVIGPLIHYLRRERPSALQISMWPLTIAGVIATRLANTKTRLVLTDHVTLTSQYGGNRLTSALLRASVRLFYPMAEIRTAVSSGSAADLARLSGAPVTTIFNPISAVLPGPAAFDCWHKGQRRLLSVGRLTAEKNHAMIVDALSLLNPALNVGLVVLGEGELRTELERKADGLGLGNRVILPGYVSDPSSYYRAAEVFILSSNFEGFGNVLVEALSAGISIISTDCPHGPAEILKGGQYGRLVECGNPMRLAEAIECVLSKPFEPICQKVRAAEFNEDVAVDRYLELMLSSKYPAIH